MKALGIETRGAGNTIFWAVVALIIFFWILSPLKDKMMAGRTLKGKEEPKKA
jgi:hypothetical protein